MIRNAPYLSLPLFSNDECRLIPTLTIFFFLLPLQKVLTADFTIFYKSRDPLSIKRIFKYFQQKYLVILHESVKYT